MDVLFFLKVLFLGLKNYGLNYWWIVYDLFVVYVVDIEMMVMLLKNIMVDMLDCDFLKCIVEELEV